MEHILQQHPQRWNAELATKHKGSTRQLVMGRLGTHSASAAASGTSTCMVDGNEDTATRLVSRNTSALKWQYCTLCSGNKCLSIIQPMPSHMEKTSWGWHFQSLKSLLLVIWIYHRPKLTYPAEFFPKQGVLNVYDRGVMGCKLGSSKSPLCLFIIWVT